MIGSTTPQDVGVCSYFEETGTIFLSPANPLYLYLHQNGIIPPSQTHKGDRHGSSNRAIPELKISSYILKGGKLPELDFPFFSKKCHAGGCDRPTNMQRIAMKPMAFQPGVFLGIFVQGNFTFFAIHKGYLKHFHIFISVAIFCRPASLMPFRANPASKTDFPANEKLFKFEQ